MARKGSKQAAREEKVARIKLCLYGQEYYGTMARWAHVTEENIARENDRAIKRELVDLLARINDALARGAE